MQLLPPERGTVGGDSQTHTSKRACTYALLALHGQYIMLVAYS